MPRGELHDYGFKYRIGDIVTHVGFLRPVRQPTVQQFEIVNQTLIAGPGCSLRYYYIRLRRSLDTINTSAGTLRIQEEHLAFIPEEERDG